MRSKPLVFGDELPEQYRDTVLIKSFLQDGDIDFGNSDTKSEPCKTYYINHHLESATGILKTQNCPDKLVVLNMEITD